MAALSDADILKIVRAEREAAQAEDDERQTDRQRAYDYLFADPDRGLLKKDLPPEPGQSKATSTDVSDAVETVLPDLMEIFTGGENVVAFEPVGEEDEDQADQETDYVNYVFYRGNPGWMTLYTHIKDALLSKTGVFKWWWEESEEWDTRLFENVPEDQVRVLLKEFEGAGAELDELDEDELKPDPETGGVTFRARKKTTRGAAKVSAVPPEDFIVSKGATSIADAAMAGNRSRVRAYQLIDQGFDPKKVALLDDYDAREDGEVKESRSPTNEGLKRQTAQHVHKPLRSVEVWEYHIWLDADGDGKVECWRVVTGNDDSILLVKERLDRIQYAVDCPYPVTHEFYGRSLADLLIEVQKIKTALMRMMLNAYYFGVNPRPEVDMTQANRYTLSDLTDNRPTRPIRTNGPNAINWRTVNATGESVLPALEFMSTVGENRSGVVRNAQGLNPDTLHDTAKGAMELMAAAQRRVRMIARIFAETGVKDLFLGLHDLIVKHARQKETVRLRGKWVDVDPNRWDRRKDLIADVGLGSSTKTAEQAFWGSTLQLQERAAPFGLADETHVFNALKQWMRAGNVRNPDMYFANPALREEGEGQPQQPPDPEVIKVQGELQLKREKAEQEAQIEMQKLQVETQIALFKAQMEVGLAAEAQETQNRIAAFRAQSDAQTKTMSAAAKAATDRIRDVRMGGDVG